MTLFDQLSNVRTMDAPWCPSRRRLLISQLSVVTGAALAGCGDRGDEDLPEGEVKGTPEKTPTEEGDTSDTASSDDSEDDGRSGVETIDPREANVVDISFEKGNGTYAFDATLHHDDDGEDGYANWWQVERLDGTQLGRRELLHAHSQQPFTRSETIDIPEDVLCVIVRGHDQTHEYGGLAAVVNLTSGDTRLIDQGPERQVFNASDCP